MKGFEGKKALVTGGSRGIGRAISLLIASRGTDVAINFVKNEEAAASTAAEIEKLGRKCFVIKADVSDPKEIKHMFSRIREDFGVLDMFISNAVSGVLGPAERIGRFGWDRAINTNSRAFMLLTQQAIKLFPESGGKIVAVSSVGSITCLPGYAAVGASKAALETLVKYFARELAPRNINVNAVSGGPVETSALDFFPDKEKTVKEWKSRAPSNRIAQPGEIASVVGFLLSEEAAWIQGQTIIADGGMTL